MEEGQEGLEEKGALAVGQVETVGETSPNKRTRVDIGYSIASGQVSHHEGSAWRNLSV